MFPDLTLCVAADTSREQVLADWTDRMYQEHAAIHPEITAGLTGALVCSLDIAELRRAFGVTGGALLVKIERVDAGLANRLTGPLRELVS